MKIRGNTVGTPMKRPDFNQTDPKKSDYILNNPIPVITEKDNGCILRVVDGVWKATPLPVYNGDASVEDNTPLISFTIDGNPYQAKEGMPWGEWVISDYCGTAFNTNGALGSNYIQLNQIDDSYYVSFGGYLVEASESIYEYEYETMYVMPD